MGWQFVRKQVVAGGRAYIVYPVIEGPSDDQPELDFPTAEETTPGAAKQGRKTPSLFERPTLKAATSMYEALRDGALAGLRLGLLHGRLSADDKEVVMRRFQRGETGCAGLDHGDRGWRGCAECHRDGH